MDIFSTRYFEFIRLVHEVEPECQNFPDIFFPEDWETEEAKAKKLAKEFCERCPIKSECLEFAVHNNEQFGIWGGTTPHERRHLRKSL